MKKLFNLKMAEGMPVIQHLNEFNIITNQLSFVEINFDNEIQTLILLVSLLNSWEAIRMVVSNSIDKTKLKYDDIRDLVLVEEVQRKDSDELQGSGSVLNVNNYGIGNRRNAKSSNKGRSKSKKEVRVIHTRDKLCVGIVKNLGTSRKIVKIQRKNVITLQTW